MFICIVQVVAYFRLISTAPISRERFVMCKNQVKFFMRGMREVKGAKCVIRPNVIQDSIVEKKVFQTLHRHFTPVKQVWRPKQSRSHSFKFSKSVMLLMHYKNDSAFIISNFGRFSFITKTKPQKEPMWFNLKGKSSSSS